MNAGAKKPRDDHSLIGVSRSRETKIEKLRLTPEALEIEKCATEQESQQLQNRPASEFDFAKRDQAGTVRLRPNEKIALFLELFGARKSVYPKFRQNAKTGKKGYSPDCDNEWRPGICRKS